MINHNNFPICPERKQEFKEYIADPGEPDDTVGKFITFEGGEGCGKSTQAKMLYDYLSDKGVKILLTREVGGTPEAEKIRDVLLHSELLPFSEIMLVMAARFEHLSKLIIPALKRGVWVVCDRFVDSTAVYQGKNSEIGIDKVYELYNVYSGALMPDVTFFIDLPPKIALQRAKYRGDNNKFEDKNFAYHNSVYEGFTLLSKKFKDRIVKVKAQDRSKEEIHANILKSLGFKR